VTTPRFESESNDLQRQDIWLGPSTLSHVNAIKMIVHHRPCNRDAPDRTTTVKAFTKTTIKISIKPRPNAIARLPLLVSNAMVVVITRVR
jgi:hypothetical protein